MENAKTLFPGESERDNQPRTGDVLQACVCVQASVAAEIKQLKAKKAEADTKVSCLLLARKLFFLFVSLDSGCVWLVCPFPFRVRSSLLLVISPIPLEYTHKTD